MKRQRQRPNSVDVARLAGVSQSAVSRCFTPGASISAQTRSKVLRAARELGYHPNLAASSLVTNRSNLIAVLLPHVTNRYFPEVLLELSGELARRELRVLLFTFDRDEDADALFADVLRRQVDGVIIAGRPGEAQLDECRRRGVPVVLFNRDWPELVVSSVRCDHRGAAAELARRLVAAGRRKLALVGGPRSSQTNRQREAGFTEQLQQLDLELVASACGHYRYADAATACAELLRRAPDLDAIFCTNDVMAYAAIDTLREQYKVTPGEAVAVAGYDDMTASEWGAYRLTTVRQPLAQMVSSTVGFLLEEIRSDDAKDPSRLVLKGELIVRESAII